LALQSADEIISKSSVEFASFPETYRDSQRRGIRKERKLKQKWKLKEAWWYAIPTDDNDDDEDEDDDHDDDDL